MLKFENPENGRYYYIQVTKDAFSDHVLAIIRGGLRAHVIRYLGFESELALLKEVARITKKRLKRGYSLVSSEG